MLGTQTHASPRAPAAPSHTENGVGADTAYPVVPISDRLLAPLRSTYLKYRFRRRRKDGRAIRLRVADVGRLFADFDRSGVEYLVMRWFDEVPLTAAEHAAAVGDVDVLIRDYDEDAIAHAAARNRGDVVVELRSEHGRLGNFAGMPYFPPTFANAFLTARVRHERGFWVPAPEHQLPAVLFHLCYHKAEDSGLPTGCAVPQGRGKRDYGAKLRSFAQEIGATVPDELTLTSIHDQLHALDGDMRLDLLERWPRQSPWIKHLTKVARKRHREAAKVLPGVVVFILRDDLPDGWAPRVVDLLAERIEILHDARLDPAQRRRVERHVRGGNWHTRPGVPDAGPVHYVVGRVPTTVGAERQGAQLRIKRAIREDLRNAARAAGLRCRHGLHGADSAAEAHYMLATIWGTAEPEEQVRLAALFRGADSSD